MFISKYIILIILMLLAINSSAVNFSNKQHTEFAALYVKVKSTAVNGTNKKQRKVCWELVTKYKHLYIEIVVKKRPKLRSTSYWKKTNKEMKKALALKD